MSTLRAVDGQSEPTVVPDAEDDTREMYDPRMDPEAKLLCALMWAEAPTGRILDVIESLSPADFRHYAHRRLFSLIAEQAAAGSPLDPTIIAARCDAAGAAGRDGWPEKKTPQRFILEVASLNALPAQITYLAELVLGASYRRQFQAMAAHLSQAGEEADTEDLFDLMVEHGRRQRAARARLDAFRRDVLGRKDDTDIVDGEVLDEAIIERENRG
jgi:hypothetical protein